MELLTSAGLFSVIVLLFCGSIIIIFNLLSQSLSKTGNSNLILINENKTNRTDHTRNT